MSGRTTWNIVILLLLLALAGASVAWWYLAIGRFPLRGDMRHDFGDVSIVGRSATAEHTFTLRNPGSEPIVIERASAGCGCAVAELSTMTVEPGGTVDVATKLTLSNAGDKNTYVSLAIADFGVQNLFLNATGRKGFGLWANLDEVDVRPGDTTPLLVFAEIESTGDEPDPLRVTATEGVEVEFRRWDLVSKPNPKRNRPARWRGHLGVTMTAETLPVDAHVRLEMSEADPVVIGVSVKAGD